MLIILALKLVVNVHAHVPLIGTIKPKPAAQQVIPQLQMMIDRREADLHPISSSNFGQTPSTYDVGIDRQQYD